MGEHLHDIMTADSWQKSIIQIGRLMLDGPQLTLRRKGKKERRLQPMQFQLLSYLFEWRNAVIEYRHFLTRFWPQMHREGALQNLRQHVSRINKALTKLGATDELWIEREPRRGYKLLVRIEPKLVDAPSDCTAPKVDWGAGRTQLSNHLHDPSTTHLDIAGSDPSESEIRRYVDRWSDIPLFSLLDDSRNLESELVDEVYRLIEDALRYREFGLREERNTPDGGVMSRYCCGQEWIDVSRVLSGRHLSISVSPSNRRPPHQRLNDTLREFGLVQQVSLDWDEPLPIEPWRLWPHIVQRLKAAYRALETLIVNRVEDFETKTLATIFEEIRECLRRHKRAHLLDRCYVVVSDEVHAFYRFDREGISAALKRYKECQHSTFSPLQLTAALLRQAVPFQQSLAKEAYKQRKVLPREWMRVPYAGMILDSEMELYRSTMYSAWVPASVRDDWFLILACPTDIAAQLFHSLEEIRGQLQKLLQEGLKDWSEYVARIHAD